MDLIENILQRFFQASNRYPVELKGEWGYMNRKGKLVIDPKYQFAAEFHNGRGRVQDNYLFGFVNTKGKLVIDCVFEEADMFSEGLCAVRRDGLYGYIDKKGKLVIPYKFQQAGLFLNGLASVSIGHKNGFINAKGEEVIPLAFGNVEYPWGGLFRTIGRKEFYYTRKGKQIWPNERYFSKEEMCIADEDGELPF